MIWFGRNNLQAPKLVCIVWHVFVKSFRKQFFGICCIQLVDRAWVSFSAFEVNFLPHLRIKNRTLRFWNNFFKFSMKILQWLSTEHLLVSWEVIWCPRMKPKRLKIMMNFIVILLVVRELKRWPSKLRFSWKLLPLLYSNLSQDVAVWWRKSDKVLNEFCHHFDACMRMLEFGITTSSSSLFYI